MSFSEYLHGCVQAVLNDNQAHFGMGAPTQHNVQGDLAHSQTSSALAAQKLPRVPSLPLPATAALEAPVTLAW